jgi:hypothetical protein
MRDPGSMSPDEALALQQTIGNRAVNRLLAGAVQRKQIQAKLTVSEPGDESEREADRVAKQVVRSLNEPASPGAFDQDQNTSGEKSLMRSPLAQRQPDAGTDVSAELESSIQQSRGGGQPLADQVRRPMERAFGADFGGVRIHEDAHSDALNRSVQARAFTFGNDVFFRRGEYNPNSNGGLELIAHELTHVTQQRNSQASPSRKIHRKFGFEIEVPLLITGKDADDDYIDPKYTTGVNLGYISSLHTELHVDHMTTPETTAQLNAVRDLLIAKRKNLANFQEGASILEYRTDAWDETALSETDVRQRMNNLAKEVGNVYKITKNGRVMTPCYGKYYLGANQNDVSLGKPMGNIQSTYGVKLSKIPELFTWQAKNDPGHVKSKPLINALGAANNIMSEVKALAGWKPKFNGVIEGQLKGFFALLSNYLIAYTDPALKKTSALGKNQLGQLFYKTDLAELLKQVIAAEPDLEDIFGQEKTIDPSSSLFNVIDIVAKETGITDVFEVMMTLEDKSTQRYGNYLYKIFARIKDVLFWDLKNPYSAPLGPDLLGSSTDQELGPVLENRSINLQIPTTAAKGKQWYKAGEWENLGVKIYNMVKSINGIT